MITESYYWREELIRISKSIKSKNKIIKWYDSDYGEFEKEIMIGFYIIRKLIEANKLTNRIISTNIKGFKYSNNGTDVTLMNKHKFRELYDLEKKEKNKFTLGFLINQFVHSYIFYTTLDFTDKSILNDDIEEDEYCKLYNTSEKKVSSIFFNSDDNRNKFLYEIDIEKIINLFEKAGNCDITSVSMEFNPKKKDFDITSSDGINELSEEMKKLIEESE